MTDIKDRIAQAQQELTDALKADRLTTKDDFGDISVVENGKPSLVCAVSEGSHGGYVQCGTGKLECHVSVVGGWHPNVRRQTLKERNGKLNTQSIVRAVQRKLTQLRCAEKARDTENTRLGAANAYAMRALKARGSLSCQIKPVTNKCVALTMNVTVEQLETIAEALGAKA